MVTYNQIRFIWSWKLRYKRRRSKALGGCPHKYAIVIRSLVITPRKPNSAKWSCAITFIKGVKAKVLVFYPFYRLLGKTFIKTIY